MINGDELNNTLDGTVNDDEVNGLGGNDILNGLEGNDILDGGDGVDSLFGGDNNDTLIHSQENGSDSYDGGNGFDTLELRAYGSLFQTSITSIERLQFTDIGAGTDFQFAVLSPQLFAATGITHLSGSDGVDGLLLVLASGGGSFFTPELTFENWTFTDLFSKTTDGVYLSAQGQTGDFTLIARDNYGSVQILAGGLGNNTLIGSNGADVLDGGGGFDSTTTISGNGGDDVIVPGVSNSNSSIDGGEGFDTLFIEVDTYLEGTIQNVEAIFLDLEISEPARLDDEFFATFSIDPEANPAHLTFLTNAVIGGTGLIQIDEISAGSSFDLSNIQFQDGADIGFYIEGDGYDGGKIVVPATWIGSSTSDLFAIYEGQTTVTGGAGADIFQIVTSTEQAGSATITDFTLGEDIVELTYAPQITFDQLISQSSQVGNNTVIELFDEGVSYQITLQNIDLGDLTEANFELIPETDDQIFGDANANTLSGFGGNDRIEAFAGDDILNGGDGDDFLVGGADNDQVYGGAGNDNLQGGFEIVQNPNGGIQFQFTPESEFLGDDLFDGGDGFDNVGFYIGSSGVTVDLRLIGPQDTGYGLDSFVGVETIIGTSSSDRLTGNDQNNYLDGWVVAPSIGGNDDIIRGLGGDDLLAIAFGNHIVDGGEGVDTLRNFYSYFDFEDSETKGGAHISLLLQGQVQDTGFGTLLLTNVENLSGWSYEDELIGDHFDNVLGGGDGSDALYGLGGNDIIYGDSTFYLDETGYVLNEFVRDEFSQDDILLGGDGDDVIYGEYGDDILLGGAGDDEVYGGDAADNIFGEDGADVLNGGAGIDYLVGGEGDDVLDGGADADAIYGQDGADTLIGGEGFVTDILVGGAGNDILHGDSGQNEFDFLYGEAGDDSYYVDTGADLTFEGADGGTDTVYADISNVTNAGVYLYANVENLVLLGTTGFGVGNELDNELTGSDSGNFLLGGAGNDLINGGAGGDVLFGEAGADTFLFENGTGGDVIGDFAIGEDQMDISAFGFESFAALQTTFIQNGDVGAINLGNGDFIVLHNVQMDQLTEGDFAL